VTRRCWRRLFSRTCVQLRRRSLPCLPDLLWPCGQVRRHFQPLHHDQAPWKRIWKGPLPPRRITPATTIGDFLIPALVSSARGSRCRDPVSTEFRNSKNRRGRGSSDPKQLTFPVESNRVTPHPTQPSGAEKRTEFGKPRRRIVNPTAFHAIHTSPPTPPTTPTDSFAKPNRRLVSPIVVPHPISYTAALTPPTPTTPISYAAAVMAGGQGGRRGAPAGQRAHRGRGAHPGRHPHGQGVAGREDALAAEVHAPLPNRGGGRGSGRGGPRGRARAATGQPPKTAPAGRQFGRLNDGAGPSGDANKVEPPPQTAEGADQGKQKRKRKAEPPVKLECTICLEDHYTNRCPLLRGPKPTVAYCAAAEDGMGFFMIQQARPNQIVTLEDSDFSALVTVEKGNVSAELLQSELARILPV